jgi:RNA polymerase sigma-70 factor (ECF subfamily)
MIMMMDLTTELDQMIRDGQGKSHYFATTLVSQYYGYIHRLAIYLLGDLADADDACQDTFIDALLYIDRYSPGTNLRAWLSKIAVHKCQQVLRKRKIRDSLNAVIRTRHARLSEAPTLFEAALAKEEKERIWTAINALGEKHRLPVILYYVYEFKISEIAGILEIPEGTVCSRLHYAVQKLGNSLKGSEESSSKQTNGVK